MRGLPGGVETSYRHREIGSIVLQEQGAAMNDDHWIRRLLVAAPARRRLAQPIQKGAGVVGLAAAANIGVGRFQRHRSRSPGRGERDVRPGDGEERPSFGAEYEIENVQCPPARPRPAVLDGNAELGGKLGSHQASAEHAARDGIGRRDECERNQAPHPFVQEEAAEACAKGDSGQHGKEAPLYPEMVGELTAVFADIDRPLQET